MGSLDQANMIVVVDHCQSDYEPLIAAGEARGIRFTFVKTAEIAVRFCPRTSVLAWIINMRLPCTTGLELYESLKSRLGGVPVLMVDDEYDAGRELSVLRLGRLHYLCKPLEASWIEHLHLQGEQ